MNPIDIWNAATDAAVKEYKSGVNAIKALKKRPEVTIDGECEEVDNDKGRIQRPHGRLPETGEDGAGELQSHD